MTMGIIKYGFNSLLRNKGRTFGITVVVIIAVALFSGISIASESLTSYDVQKSLNSVLVDIRVSSSVDDPANITSILAGVKGDYPAIQDIYPVSSPTYQYQLVINGSHGISWPVINASGFDRKYFEPLANIVGIDHGTFDNPRMQGIINITQGSFPNDNKSIMIDNGTAYHHDLAVGMNMSIGVALLNTVSENYTYKVLNFTISGLFSVLDYRKLNGILLPYMQFGQSILWANFAFIRCVYNQIKPGKNQLTVTGKSNMNSTVFSVSLASSDIYYNIMIVHGVINVLDISGSLENLLQISNKIYSRGGITYNFNIQDELYWDINSEVDYMNGIQKILLVMVIPPLFIGIYLAMTLSNQAMERRIPEIGQLRCKGATSKQIATWLALENCIIGLIGGLLGYLAGFGTSFLFLQAELQQDYPDFLSKNLVHGDVSSCIFAILIGVGTCLVAIVGPIRQLYKIPIIDLTKKQVNYQTYKPWKSRLDGPALISGALPIIWTVFFYNANIQSLAWQFQSLFLVINQIMLGGSLLASFFLSYGLIKLIVGQSPERFSKIARGIANVVNRKFAWMIGRNVGGRPRQSGGIVFILALTVCMGMIMPIIKASETSFNHQLAHLWLGSDLKAYLVNNDENASITLKNKLLDYSPDIAQVTPALYIYWGITARGAPLHENYNAQTGGDITTDIQVLGINASEYAQAVRINSTDVTSGDPIKTFTQLANTPNGVLLMQAWAQYNDYHVNDTFVVTCGTISIPFVVEGFFSLLPGTFNEYYPCIAVNLDYLKSQNFSSIASGTFFASFFFIRMVDNPHEDANALANGIQANFPANLSYVDTFNTYLNMETSYQDGALISITDIFDVEFTFIVIIATAGVTIIIYRSLSDRRREIAMLRARGMDQRDLFKILVGEGTTLVILGLILGCMGILIAYSINLQIAQVFETFTFLPRPFVIPLDLLLQVGITFGVIELIVLILSWREVKRTEIPKIADTFRLY